MRNFKLLFNKRIFQIMMRSYFAGANIPNRTATKKTIEWNIEFSCYKLQKLKEKKKYIYITNTTLHICNEYNINTLSLLLLCLKYVLSAGNNI